MLPDKQAEGSALSTLSSSPCSAKLTGAEQGCSTLPFAAQALPEQWHHLPLLCKAADLKCADGQRLDFLSKSFWHPSPGINQAALHVSFNRFLK